jgi:hypothetical protein
MNGLWAEVDRERMRRAQVEESEGNPAMSAGPVLAAGAVGGDPFQGDDAGMADEADGGDVQDAGGGEVGTPTKRVSRRAVKRVALVSGESRPVTAGAGGGQQLWVDKYTPAHFSELLSAEQVGGLGRGRKSKHTQEKTSFQRLVDSPPFFFLSLLPWIVNASISA